MLKAVLGSVSMLAEISALAEISCRRLFPSPNFCNDITRTVKLGADHLILGGGGAMVFVAYENFMFIFLFYPNVGQSFYSLFDIITYIKDCGQQTFFSRLPVEQIIFFSNFKEQTFYFEKNHSPPPPRISNGRPLISRFWSFTLARICLGLVWQKIQVPLTLWPGFLVLILIKVARLRQVWAFLRDWFQQVKNSSMKGLKWMSFLPDVFGHVIWFPKFWPHHKIRRKYWKHSYRHQKTCTSSYISFSLFVYSCTHQSSLRCMLQYSMSELQCMNW